MGMAGASLQDSQGTTGATCGAWCSAWAVGSFPEEAHKFHCTQGMGAADLDDVTGWEHRLLFWVSANYLLISPLTL